MSSNDDEVSSDDFIVEPQAGSEDVDPPTSLKDENVDVDEDVNDQPKGGHTSGVKTLLGDPKKAIIKLAIPMIIAMSIQTVYNLVDAIWVSLLGPDALSAVGFFFPFFFTIIALATGLGVGGGAAVSRRIGANDKAGADSVGAHTMVFMVILSLAVSIPFFFAMHSIYVGMGAEGVVIDMATDYSQILFAGAIIIFFSNVSNALLRAEGDVKKAMIAMLIGGILNIILDPIFIFGTSNPGPWIFESFGLGLGVTGAAWATLISMASTAVLIFYWMFIKRQTYLDIRFKGFKFNRDITKDVFKVGLPASIQQISMSIVMIFMNVILVQVAGNDGVAIFTTGWRISMLGILPLLGISTAVISVSGAMYGKGSYKNIKVALDYAIKVGFIFEMIVMLIVMIFASQIAGVFTTAEESARLTAPLVIYFQISAIFYPGVAWGMLSSSMFQGVGEGSKALTVTLLRTVILTPPLALLLVYTFDMGLEGAWWGLVLANVIGSVVSYTWAMSYLKKLMKKEKPGPKII